MSIPYTYLIGWSAYNTWYYGRRTSKNCKPDEFWKTYFTSSKYVREFRSKHGEPDIIQIRKIFATIEECCKWETKFLKKIDAAHNNNFLNKTNGDEHWHTHNSKTSGKYKRTQETKMKQSQKALNKAKAYDPISKQYIGKISTLDSRWLSGEIVGLSHKWSPEQKLNQSKLLKGRPKSAEHIKNVADSLRGKPKQRVCRISDKKEMSVANFKKYERVRNS